MAVPVMRPTRMAWLRRHVWVGVIPLLAGLVLVTASPASARHGRVYWVINEASKLCVDVPNGHAYPGQKVRQWHCNWSTAQVWNFWHHATWNGYNIWSIRAEHNKNLCLEVGGWDTRNAAKIILWSCHLGNNQLWVQVPTDEDWGRTSQLINLHSQRCLDVPGGTTEWGVQLQQWECNGLDPQRWTLSLLS